MLRGSGVGEECIMIRLDEFKYLVDASKSEPWYNDTVEAALALMASPQCMSMMLRLGVEVVLSQVGVAPIEGECMRR